MATILNDRDIGLQNRGVNRVMRPTVKITVTSTSPSGLTYFTGGTGTAPASLTFTADATGMGSYTSPTYLWEYSTAAAPSTWYSAGSTTTVLTVTNTTFMTHAGGGKVVNYRVSVSQAGWSTTTSMYSAGLFDSTATNGITLSLTNDSHNIPTDSSGNNPVFTASGTSVYVYEGGIQLTYDGSGISNGTFSVSAVPTNMTAGSLTDGGLHAVYANATAITADVATLEITATGKTTAGASFTVTKTQTLSKAKSGATPVEATKSVSISCFQWLASAPSIPTHPFTLTWPATISGTPGGNPTGWTSAASAPVNGFTLYMLTVLVTANASAISTSANWSASTLSSVGYRSDGTIGIQGAGARLAYTKSTIAAPSGTTTSTGPTSLPSTGSFGLTGSVFYTSPPALTASGEFLYQTDGIYTGPLDSPANTVTWSTPYLSNLKVGSLSAIVAELGTVAISTVGNLRSGKSTAVDTASGFFLGYDGSAYKFSLGNTTRSLTFDSASGALNIVGGVTSDNLVATGANSATASILGSNITTAANLSTSGTSNAANWIAGAVGIAPSNTNASLGKWGTMGIHYVAGNTGTLSPPDANASGGVLGVSDTGSGVFGFTTGAGWGVTSNAGTAGRALRLIGTTPNILWDTIEITKPPGTATTFLSGAGTWIVPPGGGSGTTTSSVTFNTSGAGATSPATFNGSTAVTISYNTVGAYPRTGNPDGFTTNIGTVTSIAPNTGISVGGTSAIPTVGINYASTGTWTGGLNVTGNADSASAISTPIGLKTTNVYLPLTAGAAGTTEIVVVDDGASTKGMFPSVNNTLTLGGGTLRWARMGTVIADVSSTLVWDTKSYPIPPGVATQYLNGNGGWSTPAVTAATLDATLTAGSSTTQTARFGKVEVGSASVYFGASGSNTDISNTVTIIPATGLYPIVTNSYALGSTGFRWNNITAGFADLTGTIKWGAYTIAVPSGGTTTFLRNDGTWATPVDTGITLSSVLTGFSATPNSAVVATDTLIAGIGKLQAQMNTKGAGSVTSVAVSGGTTGLTTSGGPIVGSGTITLAGTLAVANGGTGNTAGTALTTQSLTFTNAGGGAASLSTFNGGTARTISYDTIMQPASGSVLGYVTTGAQTFAGAKTFSAAPISATGFTIVASNIGIIDATSNYLGLTGIAGAVVAVNGLGRYYSENTTFRPEAGNTRTLGTAAQPWSVVYASNGTIQPSDARLKKDITEEALGLDFINRLNPVSYRWRVGGVKTVSQPKAPEIDAPITITHGGEETVEVAGVRTFHGFIAQEVKQVLDSLEVEDFAGWVLADKEDPNSNQSIRYTEFIAPLVKSVQELSAQNRALMSRLEALESKLT